MAKILACSANGYGTGLMMKMTLDKVIEICGFKVEEDAFNSIMEGRKIAAQYDIVLCPMAGKLPRSTILCCVLSIMLICLRMRLPKEP